MVNDVMTTILSAAAT